jgi:1-acyl-sn-glycerol-3-phosphate acyltransferase
MRLARSLLYYLLMVAFSIPWTTLMVLAFRLPHPMRRAMAVPWVSFNNWLMCHVLGITFEVRGRENIPAQACVILAKHQSSWETFALQDVFPDTVFVWKQELKYIPFFGWALATQPMIAVDRDAGASALRRLTKDGAERIAQHYNVVIFPEGTRAPVGGKHDYKVGGALMASKAKVPVLPVALNSGEVWGHDSLIQRAGHVVVSIGPPIATAGVGAAEVTARAEQWIETEMRRLSPHRYPDHVAPSGATGA